MKYLLTLLVACPLAYAGDAAQKLLGEPSPLIRPNTPLSRSMSEMPFPAPSKHVTTLSKHRRDRSKSHISAEPSLADEGTSCIAPIALGPARSVSSMFHALGGHRGGIIPHVTITEPVLPEETTHLDEIAKLREQNDVLTKQLTQLQETIQLHKDKDTLATQIAEWTAKREALAQQEQQIATREQQAQDLVTNLGDIAVTVAGLDLRHETRTLTTAISSIANLTNHIDGLIQLQQDMQLKQQQFMAKVELFMEQQRMHGLLKPDSAQPSASQSRKSGSGRMGLSEIGSFIKGK